VLHVSGFPPVASLLVSIVKIAGAWHGGQGVGYGASERMLVPGLDRAGVGGSVGL
jgi:hypothetical protein